VDDADLEEVYDTERHRNGQTFYLGTTTASLAPQTRSNTPGRVRARIVGRAASPGQSQPFSRAVRAASIRLRAPILLMASER
jgi:hypothetical protein